MLKPINKSEIPDYRGKNKSEMRKFAAEAVREFMEKAETGDVFEVTGAPNPKGWGEVALADKLIYAINAESAHVDRNGEVKPFRRKGRVFIERRETFEQRKARLEREGGWK